MENVEKKWCDDCQKKTEHFVERDYTGTWVRITSECQECGEVTEDECEWTF